MHPTPYFQRLPADSSDAGLLRKGADWSIGRSSIAIPVEGLAARYQAASSRAKKQILEEFVAVSGYHPEYAILNSAAAASPARRRRAYASRHRRDLFSRGDPPETT